MRPNRPAIILARRTPMDAPNVSYEDEIGMRFFRCDRLAAKLTQPGCANRWIQAQEGTGGHRGPAAFGAKMRAEQLEPCRGCAVGALHAGHEPIRYSAHYGEMICPRCDKGTTRMIGGRTCVSCANRGYELKRGFNARGNVPVELLQRAPRLVSLRVQINGRALVRNVKAVSVKEVVLHTLRTTKGDLSFSWAPPSINLRQGRLFP